jgi:hypothetical protein
VDDRTEIKLTAVKPLSRIAAVGTASLAGALLIAGCGSTHPHAAASTSVAGGSLSAPAAGLSSASVPQRTSATAPGAQSSALPPTNPSGPGQNSASLPGPYPTPGRDPSQAADQSTVLASLPGSTSSTCENVGSYTDLRSGSIAAGNFAHARAQYTESAALTPVPQVDLYAIPRHAAMLTTLTITVDPTGAGPTKTLTSTSVQQADAWTYFAVQLPVPAPGGYQITMVSGADRGCFLVTFSR